MIIATVYALALNWGVAHASMQNGFKIFDSPQVISTQSAYHMTAPDLKKVLQLPMDERIEFARQMGLRGMHELNKMAFDQRETLDHRWRALTLLVRVYAKDSQPFLERALKSDEWFMRNAALVVLPYADRRWAVQQAMQSLSDPALIVRTAAVKTLRRLHATESQAVLWERLSDAQNYHRGEPLWIRRHMIEALEQFSSPKDKAKFSLALKDSDPSVRKVAERVVAKWGDQKLAQ
jgi:hypothetical protein